jgi:hypothetical protein
VLLFGTKSAVLWHSSSGQVLCFVLFIFMMNTYSKAEFIKIALLAQWHSFLFLFDM